MKKVIITLLLLPILAAFALAQEGYEIKVKIDGFDQEELYMGYFYGDKQYLRDTTTVDDDGYFTFKGEEELAGGIYLLVLPPDNKFFQMILNEGEQKFTIETALPDLGANPKIKGSTDNQLFYEYLTFIGDMRKQQMALNDQLKKAKDAGQDTEDMMKQLEALNEKVLAKQKQLINDHPASMTAAIIKSNMPLDEPELTVKDEKERQIQQWRWHQEHFFDNINLGDPRLLRTPFLFNKVMDYVEKMVIQHPDTISLAIDKVLKGMQPAEETFKFYLIHFLNKYASSNIVGMDAVYVFLVDNYYAKDLASWTEEEQLNKIVDEADKMKPTLIGKKAPNVKLQTKDKKELWLHDIDSPYTIVLIWDPDCGHCKKSMPDIKKFYTDYHDKGVEIFAICNKRWERDEEGKISLKEIEKCWDYIEENEIDGWINIVDPFNRSRYHSLYNIKSTPQIFILDEDKKIISKRIAGEQLSEVMDRILEMDQKEWEEKADE